MTGYCLTARAISTGPPRGTVLLDYDTHFYCALSAQISVALMIRQEYNCCVRSPQRTHVTAWNEAHGGILCPYRAAISS